MGYATGVCTSFEDIKNTITTLAQPAGWSITTDTAGKTVLYKDNLYVMIDMGMWTYGGANVYDCVRITGRTSLDSGSTPTAVGITDFYYYSGYSYDRVGRVQFPVTYHCFYYSDVDEFYFVVKYNYNYQYIAFGKSNISLPGTGLWVAGTAACSGNATSSEGSSSNRSYRPMHVDMNIYGEVSNNVEVTCVSPAIFWLARRTGYITSYPQAERNCWIHHNINGDPWAPGTTNNYTDAVGIKYLERYIRSQPQQANNQSMLMPIIAYKTCSVYGSTYYHIATLQKARHIMINYLDPETIISNGGEQWMVFPWLRKVQTDIYTTSIVSSNHTANYGWAIKKEA